MYPVKAKVENYALARKKASSQQIEISLLKHFTTTKKILNYSNSE